MNYLTNFKKTIVRLGLTIFFSIYLFGCGENGNSAQKEAIQETQEKPLHVVFVTGDEEYRSEESMPMLARLVKRELNANVKVCYALDSTGNIAPDNTNHIAGLEALEEADLMVIFTRYRTLPETERKYIVDYVESGKPIVGFRTSTHAFKYDLSQDSTLAYWNDEWPTKVFGQQWITHHGHFDDGRNPLTEIKKIEGAKHPILKGFESFEAYSWLYHVDGGDWKLYGDSKPFLVGRSLKSKHEMEDKLDQYPIENPVAWTKTYTGSQGKTARVFFTTLGHPYDFKLSNVRKIALNGIYWALGKESDIPENGTNVNLDVVYEPNNSGFDPPYYSTEKIFFR